MSGYRVVDVDNFNWQGPPSTERFITEPISQEMAEFIAMNLNDRYSGSRAPRYYRVVKEDYKLFVFEP